MSYPNDNISYDQTVRWSRTLTEGTQVSTASGTDIAIRYDKVTQRNSTPGFHNPGRMGPLLPLAYRRTEKVSHAWRGHYKVYSAVARPGTNDYYSNIITNYIGGVGVESDVPVALSSEIQKLHDQLNTKLLGKIKGTSVNMAIAWAERQRTIDMVSSTAYNIVDAIFKLKQGKFMEAAKHLGVSGGKRANSRFNKQYVKNKARAVSSGWLQLQYGWKPLLNDIYGSAEELANRQATPHVMKVSVKGSYQEPTQFNFRSVSEKMVTNRVITGFRRVKITKGVTFFRAPGAPQDLPRLGITNPLLVAWELVPFSFVVDWFLPLGNWLETLDATLGVQFLDGYSSVLQTTLLEGVNTQYGVASGLEYDCRQTSYLRWMDFRRTPLLDFPSVGIPRFKNPVSVGHMLNGLALLTQAFGRRR